MKKTTTSFIRNTVVEYGNQYIPAILPADIQRGSVGDCFDQCLLQVFKNSRYKYVEGIARDPERPESWIYHAWVTDGTHAFDPTWLAYDNILTEKPVPTVYIGIVMETDDVVRFVNATGYKGVLANHWRAPSIFADILKPLRSIDNSSENLLAALNVFHKQGSRG